MAKKLLDFVHNVPREVGMASTLTIAQSPLEGVYYRGGDDAWNIAALLAGILRRSRT